MAKPTYPAPPVVLPSLGAADFPAKASSYLGWIPVVGTYFENMAAWLQNEFYAELPDGSAGAPSLAFELDPDTGIRRKSANKMGFVAGGIDALEINSAGAVLTGLLSGSAVQSSLTSGSDGQLMPVGAFGQGQLELNHYSGDILNPDLPSQMVYTFSATNMPPGAGNGYCRIDRYGSGYARRIYQEQNAAGAVWTNVSNAGAWRGWQKLDVENGANINGAYTRLPDGTQICWGYFNQKSAPWTTTDGALYQANSSLTLTYPAVFSSQPIVVPSAQRGAGLAVGCSLKEVYNDRVILTPWASISLGGTTAKAVSYCATGRWF